MVILLLLSTLAPNSKPDSPVLLCLQKTGEQREQREQGRKKLSTRACFYANSQLSELEILGN